MSKVPYVKVLAAINPSNSGTGEEVLVYKGLSAAVQEYARTNPERVAKYRDSVVGSPEKVSAAKQLASEYFLRIADNLVHSHGEDRDIWADRFTKASIELYGEPDPKEATRLLWSEYKSLDRLQDREGISEQHLTFLRSVYAPMFANKTDAVADESSVKTEREAIHVYGEVVRARYKPLFDLIDTSGRSEFSVKDLQQLFALALEWLKDNDDPDWSEWVVVESDRTTFSVDAANYKIKIASRREAATPQDARALIAHELLVHALRGKNGYKTGDKKLATGLEGYLEAEEGLGILTEEAINGELPGKAYDRYVDIALALGSVDGVQRSRKQLFQISFARQLIRAQVKGILNEDGLPSLRRKVWGHVDRIYRGGPGDDLGTRQAIFTKDVAYYIGYKRMAAYITEQFGMGKTADEVFVYLSQAKFDPTNLEHVERLTQVKSL